MVRDGGVTSRQHPPCFFAFLKVVLYFPLCFRQSWRCSFTMLRPPSFQEGTQPEQEKSANWCMLMVLGFGQSGRDWTNNFDFDFDFAPVCHGAAAHLGHRGWDLTNITHAQMLQNPAGPAARELYPGLQPATIQCSATCKILSQGHPINQKMVLACHLQHSHQCSFQPTVIIQECSILNKFPIFACGSPGPCQWNFFLVTEVYDSILEICFLHCKFICRTVGEESTCVESTSNKSFPWAPNKLRTQNWKCSAGTKLSATGKVLRETRFNGMLCFRLSYISAPCKRCHHVFWETPTNCTVIGMYIHIFFFSASALTLGSRTGVRAGLTWLDQNL